MRVFEGLVLRNRDVVGGGVRRHTERMSDAPSPIDVDTELKARLEAAYDENGVDRSLIRSSLAKTPVERLRALEDLLNGLATARRVDR